MIKIIPALFACILFSFLPRLNGVKVSVSGISSGGFAAVQFQVSFSSSIDGAGIIAGGPYYCANDNVAIALSSCMTDPSLINVSELVSATNYAADLYSIDSPSNMQKHKVWMFSGTEDTVVKQGVMLKLQEYYGNFVLPANTKTVFNISAEHAFITADYGNPCSYLGEDYINNCDFDAAGEILKHVHGDLNPPTNWSANNFITLQQGKYISIFTPKEVGMYDTAYVYVPTKCQSGNIDCDLHIAFHGCKQSIPIIGDKFYTKTGFNGWAEANNIVILYPQAQANDLNPDSCFDWWGYSGVDYACKLGPQNAAIKGMMDYLLSRY